MRMNSRFGNTVFSTMVAAVLAAPLSHAAETNALSVAKQYMGQWNEHNANKAATYFDVEDAIYFDAAVGTPQQGAVVARDNVIKPFMSAFPNLKWEMTASRLSPATK